MADNFDADARGDDLIENDTDIDVAADEARVDRVVTGSTRM